MNNLSYIDLHCDTAYELYKRGAPLRENELAISLKSAEEYAHYAQFFAVWSDSRLSDEETWEQFGAICRYFDEQLEDPDVAARIVPVRTYKDFQSAWANWKNAAILAVEDARLLAGKLGRLEELARRGVRYLTLLWGGETCIGGSHDTESGLTPFGRDVVRACFDYGIVPDLSHASERSAHEILDLATAAGKPVIATHSDAYSVHPHSRNLRDEHFRQLRALGGIVGLNLCVAHLSPDPAHHADMGNIMEHISYYVNELDGGDTLAIGGDLDGTDLPDGFRTVADIAKIADELRARGFSQNDIERLYFRNAQSFIQKNF